MNYLEVNGTALRYDLCGERGPVLVLIHEMGGLIENWDEVVPHFAGNFRILRYDSRGCGLSEKLRGDVSVETLSDDLLALLDALDLKEPVAIAGCALGSATAIAFAARFPHRTSAIIAMSPALDMKPEDRPSRRAMLENVIRDGMQAIVNGAMESGYPASLRERNPERFRAFKARWLGNDPRSFAAQYRMLIDMDITHYLRAVKCPALGIGGSLDIFRTPQYVQNVLGVIPQVEFVIIETSHHQSVETPDEIAEAILGFLDRRLSRAGA